MCLHELIIILVSIFKIVLIFGIVVLIIERRSNDENSSKKYVTYSNAYYFVDNMRVNSIGDLDKRLNYPEVEG